jgi:hypothetical protein
MQTVLARRIAAAAQTSGSRADRMAVELFEERRWNNDGLGIALIRDGDGMRSVETLMHCRSAAMAELMRALRTLEAIHAEQAAPLACVTVSHAPASRVRLPNGPDRYDRRQIEDLGSEPRTCARALQEPPASWTPYEPERQPAIPGLRMSRGEIGITSRRGAVGDSTDRPSFPGGRRLGGVRRPDRSPGRSPGPGVPSPRPLPGCARRAAPSPGPCTARLEPPRPVLAPGSC